MVTQSKRRIPNQNEMAFIHLASKIREKRVTTQDEFDSAVSGRLKEIATELLTAIRDDGIDGFQKSYAALELEYKPLKEWRQAIEVPSPPADTEKSQLYEMHPLSYFKNMPKKQWGVDKLIYDRGTSAFVGDGGSGKSALVLDMMLSRVYNRQFAGRDVKPGFIVWVAAESVDEIYSRVYAWQLYHQIADERDPNIWFIDEQVPFNNLPEVESFIENIQKQTEKMNITIDGFVFDTYARCTPGADENSTQETKLIVASIARIAKVFNTHVSIIHHTNAQGKMRGSTVFKNDLDTVWIVSKNLGAINLHCEKMRGTIEPPDFSLKMVSQILSDDDIDNTGPVVVAGDEKETAELLTPRIQMDMLEILYSSGSLSSNAWQKNCQEAHQISSTSFYNHLKFLVGQGLIDRLGEGKGKRVTYSVSEIGVKLLG